MDKNRLSRFISKYNLAGLVESVSWKAENKTLTTRFISDDKTVLGTVTVSEFDFEDSTIGVYNTHLIFFARIKLCIKNKKSLDTHSNPVVT